MFDDNEIARIRKLCNAATPGPWEHGDRQHIAAVSEKMFGPGKCMYCCLGEPSWAGKMPLDGGRRRLAHVHTETVPHWKHGIYAVREAGSECVVNDTSEYGYVDDDDANFIAQARLLVPALLDEVERLQGLLASQISTAG